MTQPVITPAKASYQARLFQRIAIVFILVLLAGVCALVVWNLRSAPSGPIAELPLADGRTFRIEAVTFGTNHVVGRDSALFNRFGRWLPRPIVRALQPTDHRSEINATHPSLVFWVNAIDTEGRTNVDCQGVRAELGGDSENWCDSHSYWFGGGKFWRVGHEFTVYPRDLTNLTIRVTPWRTNVPVEVTILNPAPISRQPWVGSPPPQERGVGEFTVRLDRLTLRGSRASYRTASSYWDPVWQVLQAGRPAIGWQDPAWIAEDPVGNRGQQLGAQQPVLRFSVICYPSSTNETVAEVVTSLPPFSVGTLQSNQVQNSVHDSSIGKISFIGTFPRGSYVFENGVFLTNPPVRMGPVVGGAPSGWTGQSPYVTPVKQRFWDGHYTHVPVIYLHADLQDTHTRLGVRLRTEDGDLIPVEMEPDSGRKGIWPFLITNLGDATTVTPEIVLLHPLEATFDVDTTTLSREGASASAMLPEDLEGETAVDVFW